MTHTFLFDRYLFKEATKSLSESERIIAERFLDDAERKVNNVIDDFMKNIKLAAPAGFQFYGYDGLRHDMIEGLFKTFHSDNYLKLFAKKAIRVIAEAALKSLEEKKQ